MMSGLLALLASAVRLAVPYTLAGLSGTCSERSGVVNIGLEGMMLTGAFTAVAAANTLGSPWLGLLAAILAGMVLGLVHAVVCVSLKSNQIVSGVAITIFASGATVFFSWLIFNLTQIQVEDKLVFPFTNIPPILPLTVVIVIVAHGEAISLRVSSEGIPSQFIDMIPYILTMFVLAGVVGRATAPAADGIPYSKE